MNQTPFETTTARNRREELLQSHGTEEYPSVLEKTREYIAKHLSDTFIHLSKEEQQNEILKFLQNQNISSSLTSDLSELTNYLYHDMSELSFITREKLFELEGFEELDINAWNDIDMIIAGKRQKTGYTFLNPEHAMDIHRRIFQKTSTTFNATMPYAIADMGENIRIAALAYPAVDEQAGISSSIRMVSASRIKREHLTNSTLTGEMLNFLELCISHGVSVCCSGETGSGKTTLTGYLLREAAKEKRMFTIEEGSREWDFLSRDESGKVCNSVIHMKTVPSKDDTLVINQNKGLQIALRFNPEIIGVGEMRSDEAFAATEASNTGHTVVTTVHANSAYDAPQRIVTLCKKAYEFTDDTLFQMVTNAFPIQVYQQFLADNTRRVTQIVEVTGYENGKVQYNPLYEYNVMDNVKHGDGQIEVLGEFVKRNPISHYLQQELLKKGASKEELKFYL